MCTQAHCHTPAYPLPEPPPGAVYRASHIVVSPDELTLPQLKAQVLARIADAGLEPMLVAVSQELNATDVVEYTLYAYEPTLRTIAVYACAATPEEALADFSAKLGRWARRRGLLPVAQTMEGSQCNA